MCGAEMPESVSHTCRIVPVIRHRYDNFWWSHCGVCFASFLDLTTVICKLYRRRRNRGGTDYKSEEIAKLVRVALNLVPPRRKDNERDEQVVHLRNHHVDGREPFNVLVLPR